MVQYLQELTRLNTINWDQNDIYRNLDALQNIDLQFYKKLYFEELLKLAKIAHDYEYNFIVDRIESVLISSYQFLIQEELEILVEYALLYEWYDLSSILKNNHIYEQFL